MKIGIIGSGNVGGTLGELWAKAGHQVMFSFSRDPERLNTLAQQIGSNAQSGTPAEAADFGEVVLLAPNFWLVQEAVAEAVSLAGKVVIDTTNPYNWGEGGGIVRMIDENVSGAEEILKLIPKTRLVKAYSSFQPSTLRRLAERPLEQRLAVAVASDNEDAKAIVSRLVEDSGGRPFDLGSLHNARLMEIPGPFSLSDDLTLDAALKRRRQILGY
jgi:8-hydroxy-5-deazaflavin:NADPH oxidoreductase